MKIRGNVCRIAPAAFLAVAGLAFSGSILSQSVPPSYVASPDVYKVIAENEHFRVIHVLWKRGQRDAWHSHAGPLVAYRLSDCQNRAHSPDGKTQERGGKKGTVQFNPVITSHSLENIGAGDCETLIVEKK